MNDWVKAQLAEIGQAEAPEMLVRVSSTRDTSKVVERPLLLMAQH